MHRPYKQKPIPRSARAWALEVKGIERFLATLKGVDTSKLGPWKSKMRRYYRFRLRTLRAHRPKGILKAGV